MTRTEWESLCDGCAKCCLHKLEDEDTGDVHYTNVACRLLDLQSCRCSNYAGRKWQVKDCIKLRPDMVDDLTWLPKSCAYRLLAEGQDLPTWHPLVTGDVNSVHQFGISVLGRVVTENEAGDHQNHIVDWPEQNSGLGKRAK